MQKQRKARTETKLERKTYSLLVGLVIVFVLYRIFLKQETVGTDSRYFIFIFLLPTFLGIIIIGLARNKTLINKLNETKGFIQKILLSILYLVQGFLFSYLSIGLLTTASWEYLNKRKANQSIIETINCHVTKINSGTSRTSPNIYFEFKGKTERINIDHQTYGQYFDANPKSLELQLDIKEGIWNYYIIDSWKLINNR